MKNVDISIEGDGKKKKELVIRVDLLKEFGQSKSGKSTTIATTEGNYKMNEECVVGLNVYKPVKNGK